MPQGRAQLFIPIEKIDLERREVWGVAAEERTDKTGREKFDYAASKPFFEAWSADFLARTEATGAEKSLGNVREMHQPIVAGKLAALDFLDDAKKIRVCAKVGNDDTWGKVTRGELTGFSIGGHYEDVWDDPDEKGVKRYAARPVEISLVDNPCMYGATFEVIRADGATELRKFTAKETSMAVDRAALLARWDACAKALGDAPGDRSLAKGLYTVSRLADILSSLRWMLSDEKAERDADDEVSALPEQFEAAIGELADAFVAMAEYHTRRLRGIVDEEAHDDALPAATALLAAAVGDLTKMTPQQAKGVLKRVQKMHDTLVEWGAACAAEKVAKAADGAAATTDDEAATTAEEDDMKAEDITKAVADALGGVEKSVAGAVEKALAPVSAEVTKAHEAITELKKTVEAQAADIAVLKAQPAAAPGVAKPGVAREDDGPAKAEQPDPEKASPHELTKFALRPENAAHITRPVAA